MKNHLMTPGKLLNEKGNIREPGYSFTLNQEYSRSDIKTSGWRIKEWDYYYVGDDDYGIGITIDDNGYMGLTGITFLDFKNKSYFNKADMYWFCFGKVGMPSTSETGDISKITKNFKTYFYNDNGVRKIVLEVKNAKDKRDFYLEVKLTQTTDKTMVIATPFNKAKHFYYNQKINLLKVDGYFKFGDLEHKFERNAYGCLDWGRGVWTYKNTWFWSSMSGEYYGNRIGFNLGYGFGNTEAASENMFFFNDKAFKLDDVDFGIPVDENGKDDFLKPWHFTSKNGDIDMIFEPIVNRKDGTNVLILMQDTNQVFGRYSGKIKVGDREFKFENMTGFAEKVKSIW